MYFFTYGTSVETWIQKGSVNNIHHKVVNLIDLYKQEFKTIDFLE